MTEKPKKKRIPERQCVVCKTMKPKAELVRVVKTPEGEIKLDETGKANGRGAYVCKTGDCAEKLQKSRRMEKTFSKRVPDEIYNNLRQLNRPDEGESDINA
jgi:predicted RNA-binding protein YlxR (DUF448 family)